MALIRKLDTDTEHAIRGRVLVGRSPSSGLRLQASGASNEHAAIQWTGSDWLIRDLGSRNGTRVNDKLLLRTSFRLAPGDQITFGDPRERWTWVDGSPPLLAAIRSDGTEIGGSAGMLLLPSEQHPIAAVLLHGESWQLELSGETRQVRDQELISVAGDTYRLVLPELNPSDARTQTIMPEHSLVHARLRFHVSLDEEHVRIIVEGQHGHREISQRAFHYMLLVLARQRLEDQRRGLPDAESGWTYVDDLAKKLAVDVNALNVHVYRARRVAGPRKDESATGPWFKDAHELIQRRDGQLRLGVGDIVIERSDGAAH
jgi:FHA domain-containing protein